MTKTLGLDLGTNSIGWALVDTNKHNNKLEDKGVIIFSEGVKKEKGQEKSKAAERTGFRSARRLNFRRKTRKYQTLLVLAKYHMCPLTIEEVKDWKNSNFKKYPNNPDFLNWLRTDDDIDDNPYCYRDKASRMKINKLELGRAFYHIAQRRGFLSNRLDQSDKGIIEKHQPEIDTIIQDSTNLIELQTAFDDYFEPFDIIKKKQNNLNAGEVELKKLYNAFAKILKEKLDIDASKEKLRERLFKEENIGAVKQNINKLDKAIKNSKHRTLGQYFWKLYKDDRNNPKNKIRNNYTSRESHYLEEFEIICKAQELEGINDDKNEASQKYTGIVKELHKAIFYQRPLKSQKGLVGKCSLEPSRTRCSVSRPEFEEFRMFSFINTIKIKTSSDEEFRFLTQVEKDKIKPKFHRKSKPTFAFIDLKNTLGNTYFYNYKDNTTVSGCPTISNFKIIFGEDWKNIIFNSYTDKTIKNRKTGEIIGYKTKEEVITDIWHVLSTFTSEEKLKDFAINKLKTDIHVAIKFSKIYLKKDYANLSFYTISKILPYLKAGLLYSHAVFMANMDKLVGAEKWNRKENRDFIEKRIGEIINKHQVENKVVFVVNSLLSNCYHEDNNFHYSKEAEKGFKNDLEKSLKKEFGLKVWENKINSEKILSEAFDNFIEYLKKQKHIRPQKIDEKIISFLSGNNETGEIFCDDDNLQTKLYHPSAIEKFKAVINLFLAI